jgi:hypothetical protein
LFQLVWLKFMICSTVTKVLFFLIIFFCSSGTKLLFQLVWIHDFVPRSLKFYSFYPIFVLPKIKSCSN